MQWTVVMPSDYNGGTVTANFYWACDNVSTGTCRWALQGRAFGDNEAIDAAWGTEQEVDDANNAQNYLNISGATPAITLAGTPAASEMVQFRAFRNADHANDTLNSIDARLIAVKVTFTRS